MSNTTHIFTLRQTHAHAHTHTHTHTHTHKQTNTHTHKHTNNTNKHTHAQTYRPKSGALNVPDGVSTRTDSPFLPLAAFQYDQSGG